MNTYSTFFTFDELTDSKGHPNLVQENRFDANEFLSSGAKLSMLLENIRHVLGDKPININSGFRCAKLNSAVGSKSTVSKHTMFEAVDITPSNMSINEAFNVLIKAQKDGKLSTLRKVLQEGSWLHVEVSMSVGDYRGFFVSHDGNKTFENVA